MPKVKYDVSDVEDVGEFAQPKPGMYVAQIKEINVKQSSNDDEMMEIIFRIVKDGKGKKVKEGTYGQLWSYLPTNPSEVHAMWAARLREFIKALALKEKGALDTDKLVGKLLQVKVGMGKPQDGDDPRAEIKKILAMPKDADPDDDDDDDEDEDDASDDDDDEDGDDGDEYSEEDLAELDDDDLIEVATDEFELDAPKGKFTTAKKKKLIAAILEAQEEAEGDDDDDDEDEDGDGEDADYTEWEVDDLKAELKERGLKTAGSKKVLISRLEKDDEDDDEEPF